MTTIQDRRSDEEKVTHRWLAVAKDKSMSGWGLAKNGSSWVAWAFETLDEAERKVSMLLRDRSEMSLVRVEDARTFRVTRGAAHFSIYVGREEE